MDGHGIHFLSISCSFWQLPGSAAAEIVFNFTLEEVQKILPFARISVNSDSNVCMGVYEKFLFIYFKVYRKYLHQTFWYTIVGSKLRGDISRFVFPLST